MRLPSGLVLSEAERRSKPRPPQAPTMPLKVCCLCAAVHGTEVFRLRCTLLTSSQKLKKCGTTSQAWQIRQGSAVNFPNDLSQPGCASFAWTLTSTLGVFGARLDWLLACVGGGSPLYPVAPQAKVAPRLHKSTTCMPSSASPDATSTTCTDPTCCALREIHVPFESLSKSMVSRPELSCVARGMYALVSCI